MKILIFISILIIGISCKENCQDCSPLPVHNAWYKINNTWNEDTQIIFFGDSTTGFKKDTVNFKSNEIKAFLYSKNWSPPKGLLSFGINKCDSLEIKSINRHVKIVSYNCNELLNVLCFDNYTLVKKKIPEDKDKKYSEYQIDI